MDDPELASLRALLVVPRAWGGECPWLSTVAVWFGRMAAETVKDGRPTKWGLIALELVLEALLQYAAGSEALPPPVAEWLTAQLRQMLLPPNLLPANLCTWGEVRALLGLIVQEKQEQR